MKKIIINKIIFPLKNKIKKMKNKNKKLLIIMIQKKTMKIRKIIKILLILKKLFNNKTHNKGLMMLSKI